MDKALLFKDRLPTADVEIPGVGTVTVRALTRAEVLAAQQVDNAGQRERRWLAAGMVDPKLTEAEVAQWHAAAPAAELEPVVNKIAELSGMLDGAEKEAYKSVPDGPVD